MTARIVASLGAIAIMAAALTHRQRLAACRRLLLCLAVLAILAGCTVPPSRPGAQQGPQNPVCFNRNGNFSIERTTRYAPYTPDLGDCGGKR